MIKKSYNNFIVIFYKLQPENVISKDLKEFSLLHFTMYILQKGTNICFVYLLTFVKIFLKFVFDVALRNLIIP